MSGSFVCCVGLQTAHTLTYKTLSNCRKRYSMDVLDYCSTLATEPQIMSGYMFPNYSVRQDSNNVKNNFQAMSRINYGLSILLPSHPSTLVRFAFMANRKIQ